MDECGSINTTKENICAPKRKTKQKFDGKILYDTQKKITFPFLGHRRTDVPQRNTPEKASIFCLKLLSNAFPSSILL